MLIRQIQENLYQLRMNHMAKGLQEQLDNPSMQSLEFTERFGLLVDTEIHARENNKQNRMLKQANLKVNACPEDIDYRTPRGLDKQVMIHLITCQYIHSALNVMVTASSGLGKTWLSCALGQAAIRKKYSVYFIRVSQLFEEFQKAYSDGSLEKYRKKLAKYDLLILDDWGLASVTTRARQELLELIDMRMNHGSIIITSQFPVEEWHGILGEATISDAILDRIIHRAHHINLHGDSMRKIDIKLPNDIGSV